MKNYKRRSGLTILLKISTLFLFFILFSNKASAKIKIEVDRTYELNVQKQLEVTETQTITNESQELYIPAGEKIDFQIIGFRQNDPDINLLLERTIRSLIMREGNREINFSSNIEDETAHIWTTFKQNLIPGEKKTVDIKYIHPGLAYTNGALVDIYVNGFAKGFVFSTNTAEYLYKTTVKVPNSINKTIHFVSPQPARRSKEGDYEIFQFAQDSLVGKYAWIQLGTWQIYRFEIQQEIKPSENILSGLANEYALLIPRDIEGGKVTQKVYFDSIIPSPIQVIEDESGNLIASFKFKTNEAQNITVTGYAVVEEGDDINFQAEAGDIGQLSADMRELYTKPAQYWEVENPEIVQLANRLKGEQNNVYTVSANIYNYVVDHIDYSQVKRFGLNVRQGALKTLQGGSAVCMEYSDLFLTLARAAGIATRAVYGYGYDARVASTGQEAHQWVQIYMPKLGRWVDVDVTWGESGDLLVGGDLNHLFTHVAYKNPEEPPSVAVQAYGKKSVDLELPSFLIKTVDLSPEIFDQYKSQKEILAEFPKIDRSLGEMLSEYLADRLVGGAQSLRDGIDINNRSQIFFLGVCGLVIFWGGGLMVAIKRKITLRN